MAPGTPRRTSWRLWLALVLGGLAGLALEAWGRPYVATALFTASLAGILVRVFLRAGLVWPSWRAAMAVASSAILIASLWLFGYGISSARAEPLIALAVATQVLLLVIGLQGRRRRGGRTMVIVTGHAVGVLGSLILMREGFVEVVGVAYLGALVVLSLNAYWSHRTATADTTLRSWEAPYLILFGLGGIVVVAAPFDFTGDPRTIGLLGFQIGLLLSLSLLAGPPPLPERWRARPGSLAEFLSQAVALGLLLNALLVVVVLAVPAVRLPILLLLTVWLATAVTAEYAAVFRRRGSRARTAQIPSLTVVVAAMDEASTIARTMDRALALPSVTRLVVVVARRSSDGTRAAVQRHRDPRVVYVAGHGSSKAEDLVQAWQHVTTELALVLDADEWVEPATLAFAAGILQAHPEVGIVQGRKVARATTLLDRFVSIERRFSTLFDHPMQDEAFGAAHFGGSAALLRRRIPAAAGWWSPATLTEDIEFTMRVHQSPWQIRYERHFVVYEEPPSDFGALLRQRGRWARGWSQVARLHLRTLMRSSVPARKKVGLGWQLLTAISAPWSVFFPTLLVLWAWGQPVAWPLPVALALGFYILPSRMITFVVPYFRDPLQPVRPTPLRVIGVAAGAYLWVLVGWMLQLQALYLELSAAPKVWMATRQSAAPGPAPSCRGTGGTR